MQGSNNSAAYPTDQDTIVNSIPSSADPASTPRLVPGPPPAIYYLPNFITPAEEASLLTSANSVPLPQWRQLTHRRLQSHPSPLSAQNVLLESSLPGWLQWPADRIAELRLPNDESSSRIKDGEMQRAEAANLFEGSPHKAPNHCLVNEYLPGQGIMPHEDGPAYHPITATVSLGGQSVLVVRMKEQRDADGDGNGVPDENEVRDHEGSKAAPRSQAPNVQMAWRILCEPRSLLLTTGDAYVHTLHAIDSIEVDENIVDPGTVKVDKDGTRGVANWTLLGDKVGWMKDSGKRARTTRVSLTYRDVLKVKSLKAFGGAFKGLRKK